VDWGLGKLVDEEFGMEDWVELGVVDGAALIA
jgi:hypothetical protein